MKNSEIIGLRIAAIREQRGMSRKDLAKKAGIKPGIIVTYETGRTDIKLSNLELIADALEINIRELFIMDDSMEPDRHIFNEIHRRVRAAYKLAYTRTANVAVTKMLVAIIKMEAERSTGKNKIDIFFESSL